MVEFDLNNMYLDDNTYASAPEGDYHFTVESYEVDFSSSDKYPPNTQEVTVHMIVPLKTGETVKVRKSFPICTKMAWLFRQYLECIGLVPEKGRAKVPDLEKMIGCKGVFHLIQGVSARGNEYNNVDTFYQPSKAPAVCDNDDGFTAGDGEENPFV